MSNSSLSQNLSRPVLLLYGVGTILGAGIYVLIGEVAGEAGPLALWSFLLAAALAGITAVSYAALAPGFPEAAGEAAYVREAFGIAWLTTTIGLIAVVNGALVQFIMSSRVLYGLARRGTLPTWLSVVGEKTRAPGRVAVVTTAITVVIALALPIDRLAELTSLALLVVFAGVHAALLKLPDVRNEAGVAIAWPLLGLVSGCAVIVFRLIQVVRASF